MKKLGKYEVLGELGHGAMGIVYRARDPMINRLVALKTITTGLAGDPALLERFYREAQAAGGLQHPNIVTIYDMGLADDVPFIAMELVEGENFEQLIARKSPLAVTRKLVYAMQACRAFDFAHKRGIVHRDIKPGNVMVGKDGTVKVVDFGIARLLETSKTQTGMLIGTFAYMSPEQYHGEHANERSDIWSFGVLVYELLSYQRPFTGTTPASLMHNICNEEPAPLRTLLPECTEELEQTVSKMLRKSPGERYDSMEDVLLDLDLICKALQSQSVIDLLNQGRQFLDQENFSEARDVVRQALQFEAGNQQARALLEKVNAGLKRIHNRPKAQQLVEKGQSLLEQGKLQEAKVAAENALQLDSSFAAAEDLECAIQKELDCARAVAELLDAARQHLAEGLPDDADSALAKVLEIEPGNMHVGNLKQQVLTERAEREKTRRLQAALQHARDLWTRQDYTACIRLLQDLEREFPAEEEVTRFLDTVREDHIQQEKQQALLESRNLLAAGDPGAAIQLLSELQKRFAADEEIRRLLDDVRKDEENQRLASGLAEARSLLTAGQHEACISRLTSLRETFPDEAEIPQLLEMARQMQAEQARQKGIAEAGKLLEVRKYDECLAYLAALDKQFPGNEEILVLQRAVREQQSKQEKHRRLDEARHLLADHRYDASIRLLETMQADYPAETEITKLLASAREDLGEQKKQQILAEARALLAAQAFEEAVALLDSFVAAHPKDFAVTKLRNLVEKEQDKHSKAARIQRELDGVKTLMGEKKYPEVIARTKELLGEFPAEPNFIRLGEFAAERQANIENEKLLQKTLEDAKARVHAGRFPEAVRAAQDGLRTFPGNAELQALQQEAAAQQKKQEVRRQIEQRVRDIRVKINREQLSDAIDLAKKTLATLGPDTDISHLLNSAEVEVQAREKKRIQERTLETIRSMVSSGDLHGATEAIDAASESNIWEAFDPRVQRLLEQIREAETKPTTADASASPASAPTLLKEYAFFQPATLPISPAAPESTAPVNRTAASPPPQASVGSVALPSSPPPQPVRPASALPTEALEPLPLAAPAELPPVAGHSRIAAPRAEPRTELDRSAARSAPRATVEARRDSLLSARTVGVVVAAVFVIGATVWIAADRPKPEPKLEQGSSTASSSSGSQKTQPPKTPDSTNDTALRNLLLQESAQAALATGDFRAARQAAEQLKQNGGNPAELLASIDQAEQRELKKWEAQFEQVKNGRDSLAVQQLKTLQAKFQSAANDGGPQSAEAYTYLNKVSATLRAGGSPGAKTATNPRCEAIQERGQLGETLSDAERAFLRDSCH